MGGDCTTFPQFGKRRRVDDIYQHRGCGCIAAVTTCDAPNLKTIVNMPENAALVHTGQRQIIWEEAYVATCDDVQSSGTRIISDTGSRATTSYPANVASTHRLMQNNVSRASILRKLPPTTGSLSPCRIRGDGDAPR